MISVVGAGCGEEEEEEEEEEEGGCSRIHVFVNDVHDASIQSDQQLLIPEASRSHSAMPSLSQRTTILSHNMSLFSAAVVRDRVSRVCRIADSEARRNSATVFLI
jgi:hypothetical protein